MICRSIAHFAAAEGQLKVIRFLSEHCDNAHFERLMNHEDRWGLSPMDEAYHYEYFHICTIVKEHLHIPNVEMHRDIPHSSESKSENKGIVRLLWKWKKAQLNIYNIPFVLYLNG